MLNNTLTLSAVNDVALLPLINVMPVNDHVSFNRISSNGTSGVFQDATQPFANPHTLRVSHEVSKDGSVVNSVIILKKDYTEPVTLREGKVQVQMKVTYSPEIVTKNDVKGQVAILTAFLLASLNGAAEPLTIGSVDGAIESTMSFDAFLNLEA